MDSFSFDIKVLFCDRSLWRPVVLYSCAAGGNASRILFIYFKCDVIILMLRSHVLMNARNKARIQLL